MSTTMIKEIMPFLIPLIVVEAILVIVTVRHILTHEHYRRGSRGLWLVIAIVGFQLWGPILYFLLGREEA